MVSLVTARQRSLQADASPATGLSGVLLLRAARPQKLWLERVRHSSAVVLNWLACWLSCYFQTQLRVGATLLQRTMASIRAEAVQPAYGRGVALALVGTS